MAISNRLTLEEVAELAGVSRSTVSRVVNHHPSVRPEVRSRVLAVIERTGYRPDPVARRLAGQRSNIIGLVIAEPAQALFTDQYFPRLIQGVTKACNQHDLTLSLFLFHTPEEEANLYPKLLHSRLVDGLIVTGTYDDDPLLPKLIESDVPFVLVGYHDDPDVSCVDVDNVGGAEAAVTHLIRLGHRRIGHITGNLRNRAANDRRQGYLNALRQHGLEIDERLIEMGDYQEASGYEAMYRLMPRQVDAVFVASDRMAQGALHALQEAGLAVPGEVAVVGFDDLPPSTLSIPNLTTIRQPIRPVGQRVVDTLLDVLENGRSPARRTIVPTELVVRDSCGASTHEYQKRREPSPGEKAVHQVLE